ncbi:hypothetical protein T05_2844 [Trichinella murrelli]|uniref:Uncharacterized protein n=1 Tax=Trichinella murrelli TaxID=144512 RepID=A0A0V0TGQ0_9BILA|nr:hypothetical protein T05_2844 [Trichinella murrelli]
MMKQMVGRNNNSMQAANENEDEVCPRCCTDMCKKMKSNSASEKEMMNWKLEARNALKKKLEEVKMLQDQNEKLKKKIKGIGNMNNEQPEVVDHNRAMVLPSQQRFSKCKNESKPTPKMQTTVKNLQMEILKRRKEFAMLPVMNTFHECMQNRIFISDKKISPVCNLPEVQENISQWIELQSLLCYQYLQIKHTISSQKDLIENGKCIWDLPMPANFNFYPLPKPTYFAYLEGKEKLELMAYLNKFPLPETFSKEKNKRFYRFTHARKKELEVVEFS